MLDQIVGEGPDQPHSQHLSGKGPLQPRAVGEDKAVGDAEFSVAVDGRGPHQIADAVDHIDVGLLPLSQRIGDVAEQADGLVRAADHQLSVGVTTRFLLGQVGFEAIEVGGFGVTVVERETCVPGLGDDPVGAVFVGEGSCKGHQRIGVATDLDPVDGAAEASIVDGPQPPLDGGAVFDQSPDQRAAKAQPGRKSRPQPGQPHYGVR